MHPRLTEKLASLPPVPGVYLMKDAEGAVLYVGKAVNLRSRVRSYFNRANDSRAFIPLLEDLVDDLETLLVANEKEALLLENELIKKHRPRFNVQLRDDKNFICLRLDRKHRYPRLEVVRRFKRDGARYFGPYSSASSSGRHCESSTATSSCAPAPTTRWKTGGGPASFTKSTAVRLPASTPSPRPFTPRA